MLFFVNYYLMCFFNSWEKLKKRHLIEVKRIREIYEEFFIFQAQTYFPGSEDTVISKAVPSGRDSSIALGES